MLGLLSSVLAVPAPKALTAVLRHLCAALQDGLGKLAVGGVADLCIINPDATDRETRYQIGRAHV